MLGRILGNKATTILGALVIFLGVIDAQDVLPVAWDDMLEGVLAAVIGSGLLFAKDASTGSKPGAKS